MKIPFTIDSYKIYPTPSYFLFLFNVSYLCSIPTGDLNSILFTDEKIFTVEEATNKQNDRIMSNNTQSIPGSAKVVDNTHHPLSVMVCARELQSRWKLIFVPQWGKSTPKVISTKFWKVR